MPVTVTGYCGVGDLLTGDVPLPAYVSPEKYINDAADEIDSKIGFIYVTRVDITSATLVRPALLLLKRLNVFIATGRILMAIDAGGEEHAIHAYAKRLLEEAAEALKFLIDGKIILEGAPEVPGRAVMRAGAIMSNLDAESAVEAFYDRIANPNYIFPPATRRRSVTAW